MKTRVKIVCKQLFCYSLLLFLQGELQNVPAKLMWVHEDVRCQNGSL